MSENLPQSLQTFKDEDEFQIFIEENSGDWKMPMEWHHSLEIFYVLEGSGAYIIEDKSYTFSKGDLFVIGNRELHKSQLIDGKAFKAVVVMFTPELVETMDLDDNFDPLNLFYDRPADFSHQLKVDDSLQRNIMFVFESMIQEVERDEGYSKRGIASLLQWLLVQLDRAFEAERGMRVSERFEGIKFKTVVNNVLDYIDHHYQEEIHLDEVAKTISVNPSYMSREFKKATNFTIIEFITAKRIRLAKELLRQTDLSVTKIASDVGYNNVTHFHWTFKKAMGISPGQYRKMSKVYKR